MSKVAIVTGAIRGIGLAIVRLLMKRGVSCVVTYYDWLDDLDSMKKELEALKRSSGAGYISVSADLRKREDVERVVGSAVSEFGRLDILVNNIERGGWPVVHGPYTQKQWELEFETTVTSKWYLFNESMKYLKDSRDGCVLNISSISAFTGRSGPAGLIFNDCYSISNRAIGLLTEQWAKIGAPNVRVNELMLGFFETRHGPKTRGWSLLDDNQRKAVIGHTLLERTGNLEDVEKAVEFLAFDAPFMTGQRIILDGGYLLGGERVPSMPKGVVDPNEPTFGGSIPPRE